MNWPICSVVAEGVDLGVSGFAIHRTAAVIARGYNQCGMNGDAASARPKFSPERKDALESQVRLLDISASIWDCDAIVHLAGCSFVRFASGVRLFCQQRGESFAL